MVSGIFVEDKGNVFIPNACVAPLSTAADTWVWGYMSVAGVGMLAL